MHSRSEGIAGVAPHLAYHAVVAQAKLGRVGAAVGVHMGVAGDGLRGAVVHALHAPGVQPHAVHAGHARHVLVGPLHRHCTCEACMMLQHYFSPLSEGYLSCLEGACLLHDLVKATAISSTHGKRLPAHGPRML